MAYVRGPQLQHLDTTPLSDWSSPLSRMNQSTLRLEDAFWRLDEWDFSLGAEVVTVEFIRRVSLTNIRSMRFGLCH